MIRRTIPLVLAAAAIALVAARAAFAEEKSHEGLIVSAGAGKLTMTMMDGSNKHSHDVGKDAKIMLDEKAAKLEDLKEGFHVTVTMDNKVVTKIAAHSKVKKGLLA